MNGRNMLDVLFVFILFASVSANVAGIVYSVFICPISVVLGGGS